MHQATIAHVRNAVLLLWGLNRTSEALDVWQNYLQQQPPELPGMCLPPFYNLCIEAGAARGLKPSAG